MPRIALFGGSFNPPGIHHRRVAEALVPHFDQILVVPCGPRPDKETTGDVEPIHRAALTDIAFRDMPKVEVDLFDLEEACFTPNDALGERYADRGEIWHVVGSDLVAGGGRGASPIQAHWHDGQRMWETLRFCVVSRAGYPLQEGDLPPHSEFLEIDCEESGASEEIREHIFRREPYAALVLPRVMNYIERYGLYGGRLASSQTRWRNAEPRLLIAADPRNAGAMALAAEYRRWEDPDHPNCVLVIGGDGTMLHAIRDHWRRRLPFLGVNRGHLGFLLNEAESLPPDSLPGADFVVRLMPMLYIEIEHPDGSMTHDLAFNDAWIERATGQTAWMEVTVDGEVRISKLVADGALVCTAAGSTAYARSMGVAPLLADTPAWVVVGSNVMSPHAWKSALLDAHAELTIRSIGGAKRPLRAYVGGVDHGEAVALTARQSRIATAELVFEHDRDMAAKITAIQFPHRE